MQHHCDTWLDGAGRRRDFNGRFVGPCSCGNPAEMARSLAFSYLNDEQRKTEKDDGYFDVQSSTGNWWRIFTIRGTTGNVKLLSGKNGLIVQSRCAHLYGDYPAWDTFIAQMFTIETSESRWVRVAHKYGGLH